MIQVVIQIQQTQQISKMITKDLFIIIITFFLMDCHSSSSSKKILPLKSIQRIVIPIDNHKDSFIGYKHFEDDMDIGPNSFFVKDKYIFLLDPFHKNVKKIDIFNKRISLSNEKIDWLSDILVYKNKVIVSSDLSNVYIYDLQLKLDGKINVSNGTKYFYNNTKGHHYLVNLSKMSIKDDVKIYDAYYVDSLLYNKLYIIKKSIDTYKRVGYYNKEVKINQKKYLAVNNHLYELPHSLLEIKAYEAKNIFVEPKRISYFNFDRGKKNLIIEIFNY